MFPSPESEEPVVVERAIGRTGGEVVLRRVGADWELVANGVFLMDTRDGASERAMVRASLDALPADRTGARVLIGGLGMGFSAREALDHARVAHVHVIELEPLVITWHAGPLAPVAGRLLEDPRCEVTCADLVSWLEEATGSYDAICLDTDNGPDWTVTEGNERLYRPAALDRLERLLSPGGVIAFWSAMPAPEFALLLERRFGAVEVIEVPARRGGPDLVYLTRPRRG
ncbi:Spermidine synthase [Marinactinospora thermotolerans DSM 45154]|uniref:Spermidine synthase n=1 Tax=Marinactinospora thermotolerans DSM 45154 TaxID=1122192 RepID=A0A1T4T1N3_9ACTN|nr:Spermidine synthase [Marinactinospora thermotolerans DSM 45154]